MEVKCAKVKYVVHAGALMALSRKYGDEKAKRDSACEDFLDEFENANVFYLKKIKITIN